jgi:hypothetical protein
MTNEDKMNKVRAFGRKVLRRTCEFVRKFGRKTEYLPERVDPNLKDEMWRKGSNIAPDDGRLYTCQPLVSNGANIDALDYENKTYEKKPLLEKGTQTEKEHIQKKFIPRKEQCACRYISNLVRSEPQSFLNVNPKTLDVKHPKTDVPFLHPSFGFYWYPVLRIVRNETVIKQKLVAFFPSWITTERTVENTTMAFLEDLVEATIFVENGVVKSQTVLCTKCGFTYARKLVSQTTLRMWGLAIHLRSWITISSAPVL